MIKLAMNKSTKNVLIATLPTVLTDAVGKVVRAISKRYHLCPQCATGFKQEVRRMEASASSCEAVVVFPQNFGPAIRTAPDDFILRSIWDSIIRFKYLSIRDFFDAKIKKNI